MQGERSAKEKLKDFHFALPSRSLIQQKFVDYGMRRSPKRQKPPVFSEEKRRWCTGRAGILPALTTTAGRMPALPVHLRLFSSVNTVFLLFGGGGSATRKENLSAFLLRCARLALSFHKIGGGSATQKENLPAFLLRCARLALSLHPQTIQRTDLAACNLSKTMLKLAVRLRASWAGTRGNRMTTVKPNPTLPVSAPAKTG